MTKSAADGLRMMAAEFIENGKRATEPNATALANRALICTGAANEIAHLRDCLGSIRAHLVGQDSALAVAIRATCNSGLRETND